MTHDFDSTVLREYDIRGIIGQTLGADDARAIGRSFGTLLRRELDPQDRGRAPLVDGALAARTQSP